MRPMRTKLRGLIAGLAGAVTVVAVGVAVQTATSPAQAAAADPYALKNVQIEGGGFVPGIIFNQKQQNLVYARTDIGGAYRLDPSTNRWIPLLDWVGQDNWGYNGVVSLATDEVDPNKVYVAAGMYTNSWDPNNGAILRSSDKGATWQSTQLPFKLGGNMPGRGMGSGSRSTRTRTRSCTWAPRAATGCGAAPTPASPGRRSPPSRTRATTRRTRTTSTATSPTTRVSPG
ncbi:hypothetical protein GCM10027610_076240 [Dactylosporangium cerinum]